MVRSPLPPRAPSVWRPLRLLILALLLVPGSGWGQSRLAGDPQGVRVCAGGDVTLGTNLDPTWARRAARDLRARFDRSDAPDSLLAPLRPLVSDADIVLLNVETAIGEGPASRKCGPKSTHCYAFRAPVAAAAALRSVAPHASVVGTVANNHARDAGEGGRAITVAHLMDAGLYVTGDDSLATPVATPRGDTVAFLAFATPGPPDARDLNAVARHVRRAVDRWGVVVVTAHLGAEGATAQRTRDVQEHYVGATRGNPVAFARTVMAAGAALVMNHGPHVMRAGEWYGDRLVLHSLGNLLTYGPFRMSEPMNRGAIACVTIDPAGTVSDAELRSTVQHAPGVLREDETGRAARLVDSLSRLDFPVSGVRVQFDGRVVKRDREAERRSPRDTSRRDTLPRGEARRDTVRPRRSATDTAPPPPSRRSAPTRTSGTQLRAPR